MVSWRVLMRFVDRLDLLLCEIPFLAEHRTHQPRTEQQNEPFDWPQTLCSAHYTEHPLGRQTIERQLNATDSRRRFILIGRCSEWLSK